MEQGNYSLFEVKSLKMLCMQVQQIGEDLNRSSLYLSVPLYLKVHTLCLTSHTLLSFSPTGNKFKLTNQLPRIYYAISFLP